MGIQLRNMKLCIFGVVLLLFIADCCKGGVTKAECTDACAVMKCTDTCYYEDSNVPKEDLCSALIDDANSSTSSQQTGPRPGPGPGPGPRPGSAPSRKTCVS